MNNSVLEPPSICFTISRKPDHNADSNAIISAITLSDYGLDMLINFIFGVTERGANFETARQTPTAA